MQPQSQCFDNITDAEAFIRTEPSPEVGNQYLERDKETPVGSSTFTVNYRVKPRRYESFFGDWYKGGYGGNQRTCNSNPVPIYGVTWYGCGTEETLAADILARYPYYGEYSGYYTGAYKRDGFEPTPHDPATRRSYVQVYMNPYRPEERKFIAVGSGGGIHRRAPDPAHYACG